MSTPEIATADGVFETILLARQPIFDPGHNLAGYELLHRPPQPDAGDSSSATAVVLIDGWLSMGASRLTAGKYAFVNVDQDLLSSGHLVDLPSTGLVLEIGADVPADATTRAALEELRSCGYTLSLDRLTADDPRTALADLAAILKVDLANGGTRDHTAVARLANRAGAVLHVAKVETHEQFDEAVTLGARLVQGFFFATPEPVAGRRSRGFAPAQLQLLRAVTAQQLDIDEVEDLIRQDLALADRFLRYVNAAAFGWRREITSLRHALVLLGESGVRSWVSLLTLSAMTATKPRELLMTAATRARFSESLGHLAGLGDRTFDLFAAGMFSVIDAALDQPLEQAIADLPLPDGARAALTGEDHPVTHVLEAVIGCEQADWDRMHAAIDRLGVPDTAITAPYLDAMTWASDTFAAA